MEDGLSERTSVTSPAYGDADVEQMLPEATPTPRTGADLVELACMLRGQVGPRLVAPHLGEHGYRRRFTAAANDRDSESVA
ncbi:hypothetical protein O4220_10495 [Rhodococcus ruber]|uniref:Uncharacterized protein n=1 Tax=Rhodococcus ruber TaxID=1830 RepID=A0ABT4MD86_9NOCA|nr:hypothetical protein [Rhodococcus ruber]MCZ4518948.1 hypothetical protein [Rhodococcus ruber]